TSIPRRTPTSLSPMGSSMLDLIGLRLVGVRLGIEVGEDTVGVARRAEGRLDRVLDGGLVILVPFGAASGAIADQAGTAPVHLFLQLQPQGDGAADGLGDLAEGGGGILARVQRR